MKKTLSFLAAALLLCGCEVLEKDLTERKIRVIAPADGVTVAAGEVLFRWQSVEDATGYEFRIVTPAFAAAERVILDTVLLADTLARSYGCRVRLDAGHYAWSVAGFNGSYTTRTQTHALTVRSAQPEQDEPAETNPENTEP